MMKITSVVILLLFINSVSAQTISGNLAFCAGSNTTLTVTGAPGGATFQWQSSTDAGTTWTPIVGATAGSYLVSVAGYYDVLVNATATPAVTVTQNPSPTANFSFTDNMCSGTATQFTSTVTSGTAPFSYAWTFGDAGTSTLQNPAHTYTSFGCNSITFPAKLTVTDANGCTHSITKTVTIKQQPDVELQDDDIFNPFSNCNNNPTASNPNYTLKINNISASTTCISNYAINWGDGTAVQNTISFPLTHQYTQIGAFNLVVTATSTNGCTSSKTYKVANQSNPAGSLGTLGSTTGLCAPASIPFTITNWQLNSTGTMYVLDFGDGTSQTFTHPLNPDYTTDTVTHIYTTSSCPDGTYTATLRVVNACATTPYTAGNIQIRKKPVASFTSAPAACVNTSFCFTNTSVLGTTGNDCSNATKFTWDFGDGSTATVTASSSNVCHTYTTSGVFTVTLTAANPCGPSTFSNQVCVTNPPISSFTIDNPLGCTPVAVKATNTSNTLTDCVPATYLWTIAYSSANCGTTGQWTFAGGTNASSINPSFNFTNAGIYTITLSVTNVCGTATSSKVVTVKKPPTVSILPIPSTCSATAVNPVAAVANCGTGPLTYVWSFPGGSPSSSTSLVPGAVTYSIPGSYTVSLSVSNECGTVSASQTFTIKGTPVTPSAGNDGPLCSGSTLNLTSNSATPGVSYSWTGPLGFTSALQNPTIASTIPAMSGAYTVTVSANGCTSNPATTNVVINQTPAAPTVSSPIVYCQNATAVPLTATAAGGNTLNWYTASTGGAPTSTAPTPSTATPGPTTYYVSQVNSVGGCEGPRSAITVNVNPTPAITIVSNNPTSCTVSNGSIVISGLNPNTPYVVHYVQNGSTFNPTLTSSGTGTITLSNLPAGSYSNISVTLNGCISNIIGPFSLVTPSAPATPSASNDGPWCSGSTLTLTSSSATSGVSYSWTGPGGYTSTQQNPTRPNAAANMSGTYTVTATLNGCPSAIATTTVVINQTPTAPIVPSQVDYCQGAMAVPLSATATAGNTLNWYTVLTGGTATSTAPTPSTATPATTDYYVSQVTTASGCEGPRSLIRVVVKPTPAITGTFSNPTSCVIADGTITISGLTAGVSYLVQYIQNGSPVSSTFAANGTGAIILSGLPAGSYSNISVTLNSCVSNIVGPYSLVTPLAPATPSASNNGPLCSGATLNLTSFSTTAGVAYSWTGPAGFTSSVASPTILNSTTGMSGNYTVIATLNGCTSASATTTVVINQTPNAPIVTSPIDYCQDATAVPLTASVAPGNTLNWYTTATGGTPDAVAPTPSTTVPVTTTYYVSQMNTASGCEGPRSSIAVNVKPVPVITGAFNSPTSCTVSNGSITISGLTTGQSYTVQYNKNGSPVSNNLPATGAGVIILSNLSAATYSNISVNLNGCISNIIGPYVLVTPSAPATPSASNNGPLCSGSTLNLTSNSTTPGVTYSWTGPAGFTSAVPNPVLLNSTTSMSGTYTVIATANGCVSAAATTNVVINQTPTAPVVTSPIEYCQDATALPLTASVSAGNALNWYTAPTGGTANTVAPTPITTTPGSTTYYVSQVNTTTSCESIRTPLTVTVKPVPVITATSSNPTSCVVDDGIITISGLTAGTSYIVRYDKNGSAVTNTITAATGGIITLSNLSPGTYTNITATLNGCPSNTAGPFTLVSPTAPVTPTVNNNGPLCSGSTLNLTATTSTPGVTYAWTGPAGFSSSDQNPILPNATPAMSGTYTVIATVNGCTSAGASTSVVVNPTPSTPVVSTPVNYCQAATAAPLTATASAGHTLNWYTAATGGTGTATAPTPSTTSVGNTTYYVSQVNSTTACESGRTAIVVNVYAVPVVKGAFANPTSCTSTDGIITLSTLIPTTTYTVQYNKNGVLVTATLQTNGAGEIALTNLTAGSYTNISVTLNGCMSNEVGPFNLVNPSAPAVPTAGSNSPVCSGSTITLTSSLAEPGGTYSWTGPAGFTSTLQNPSIPNATTAMAGVYNVAILLNGCTSAPASATVTVNQTPAAPLASPVDYCENTTAMPLTATAISGHGLNWYTQATGGTATTTAPTPLTTPVGTVTYYVSQVNTSTGCESGRTAIAVNVKAVPAITGASTNPTSCNSTDGIITLSGLTPTTSYLVQYTINVAQVSNTLTSNATGSISILNLPAGTYSNITVTFNGCISNTVGPYTITNPAGPIKPTAASNTPVCSGSSILLTSNSASVGATYNWTGPAGFSSTLQNPTIVNANTSMTGTYSVTSSLNGCTSSPATTDVIVNTVSSLTASSNSPICSGTSLMLSAVATSTTGVTYSWTGPNGFASSLPNPTINNVTTAATGTYTVAVSLVQGNCPATTATTAVIINQVPVISGTSAGPTNCTIANGTITINGLVPNTAYSVGYTQNGTAITANLNSNAAGIITINNLPIGTYTNIRVTLNGCTSNIIGPFTLVNPPPPAAPTVRSNSPLCEGGTINLIANSTTPGVTYSWTGPAGYTSTQQNPSIPNATPAMSGDYLVTASINGCISAASTVNVVVVPALVLTASASSPVCTGSSLNLFANASSPAVSYAWAGPNGFSSSLQNPTLNNLTLAASGTYTVTATYLQGVCPSVSATTLVTVTQAPTILGNFTEPTNCNGANGTISISGLKPGVTYSLQYTKNTGNPTYVILAPNSNGVATVQNLSGGVYSNISASLNGCGSNVIGPYTMRNATPATPTPSASGNSPLCVGATLVLKSNSLIAGATYDWTGPNGFTSQLQNPVINNIPLFGSGTYAVTASANGCTSVPANVNVVVSEFPIVNLGPDLLLIPGMQHVMSPVLSNGPFTEYRWTPATNLSCVNCPAPTALIYSDITYQLKVKNVAGCSASDTINIKVLCDKTQVFIPDAFTPDGDGLNDVFMIRSSAAVRVKYFRVFNKWGQMVFEKMNFQPNQPQFGWDGRIKGVVGGPDVFVYTAEIICGGGTSFVYKGNVSILK